MARIEPFPTPVSRMCFWYYKGNTSQEPRMAIITGTAPGGVLDLTVFSRDRPNLSTSSGVRHKDDAYLVQQPSHALDCGCWDYLPGQKPLTEEDIKKANDKLREQLREERKQSVKPSMVPA
jgi:hypothetical protein